MSGYHPQPGHVLMLASWQDQELFLLIGRREDLHSRFWDCLSLTTGRLVQVTENVLYDAAFEGHRVE